MQRVLAYVDSVFAVFRHQVSTQRLTKANPASKSVDSVMVSRTKSPTTAPLSELDEDSEELQMKRDMPKVELGAASGAPKAEIEITSEMGGSSNV